MSGAVCGAARRWWAGGLAGAWRGLGPRRPGPRVPVPAGGRPFTGAAAGPRAGPGGAGSGAGPAMTSSASSGWMGSRTSALMTRSTALSWNGRLVRMGAARGLGTTTRPEPGKMPTDEEVRAVSAEIFGNHLGDGKRSGRKVLRRKRLGPVFAEWYGEDFARMDNLFDDPVIARNKAKVERLRRRGKSAPKKGEGKRAKR